MPVAEGVIRRSYTPNLEGDPVAVVMEFMSESDTGEYSLRPTYPYGKLYPTFRTLYCHKTLEDSKRASLSVFT